MTEAHEKRVLNILEGIIKSNDQYELPLSNHLIFLMYNLSDSKHKRNLFKCTFGTIFLLVPVFLFLLFFLNNICDTYLIHNFSNSSIPLIIGCGIVFLMIISIMIYKITGFCLKGYYYHLHHLYSYFPPWEREVLGSLIQALVVNIAIYFIIKELNQCLIYFETLKNNLTENIESTPLINSLILKMLFSDKRKLQYFREDNTIGINILNTTIKNITSNLANKPKYFNYTKILKPGKVFVSDLYSVNIIYEIILNLYYPIGFLCFLILLKVRFTFHLLQTSLLFLNQNICG